MRVRSILTQAMTALIILGPATTVRTTRGRAMIANINHNGVAQIITGKTVPMDRLAGILTEDTKKPIPVSSMRSQVLNTTNMIHRQVE